MLILRERECFLKLSGSCVSNTYFSLPLLPRFFLCRETLLVCYYSEPYPTEKNSNSSKAQWFL